MQDDAKPVTGNWDEAAAKAEQSWNRKAGKAPGEPKQPPGEAVERTEEGYGSAKEDVDPQGSEHGRSPRDPAG